MSPHHCFAAMVRNYALRVGRLSVATAHAGRRRGRAARTVTGTARRRALTRRLREARATQSDSDLRARLRALSPEKTKPRDLRGFCRYRYGDSKSGAGHIAERNPA